MENIIKKIEKKVESLIDNVKTPADAQIIDTLVRSLYTLNEIKDKSKK